MSASCPPTVHAPDLVPTAVYFGYLELRLGGESEEALTGMALRELQGGTLLLPDRTPVAIRGVHFAETARVLLPSFGSGDPLPAPTPDAVVRRFGVALAVGLPLDVGTLGGTFQVSGRALVRLLTAMTRDLASAMAAATDGAPPLPEDDMVVLRALAPAIESPDAPTGRVLWAVKPTGALL